MHWFLFVTHNKSYGEIDFGTWCQLLTELGL
jgi:hypothetical protein